MNSNTLREEIKNIVTRNGSAGRIPELLEDELDKLVALFERKHRELLLKELEHHSFRIGNVASYSINKRIAELKEKDLVNE